MILILLSSIAAQSHGAFDAERAAYDRARAFVNAQRERIDDVFDVDAGPEAFLGTVRAMRDDERPFYPHDPRVKVFEGLKRALLQRAEWPAEAWLNVRTPLSADLSELLRRYGGPHKRRPDVIEMKLVLDLFGLSDFQFLTERFHHDQNPFLFEPWLALMEDVGPVEIDLLKKTLGTRWTRASHLSLAVLYLFTPPVDAQLRLLIDTFADDALNEAQWSSRRAYRQVRARDPERAARLRTLLARLYGRVYSDLHRRHREDPRSLPAIGLAKARVENHEGPRARAILQFINYLETGAGLNEITDVACAADLG